MPNKNFFWRSTYFCDAVSCHVLSSRWGMFYVQDQLKMSNLLLTCAPGGWRSVTFYNWPGSCSGSQCHCGWQRSVWCRWHRHGHQNTALQCGQGSCLSVTATWIKNVSHCHFICRSELQLLCLFQLFLGSFDIQAWIGHLTFTFSSVDACIAAGLLSVFSWFWALCCVDVSELLMDERAQHALQ